MVVGWSVRADDHAVDAVFLAHGAVPASPCVPTDESVPRASVDHRVLGGGVWWEVDHVERAPQPSETTTIPAQTVGQPPQRLPRLVECVHVRERALPDVVRARLQALR